MIKSRNFKRVLTIISVLALVICFAQTAVFAENTVEIASGSYNGSVITVTASISGAAGAEMTMLAVITNDEDVELSDYDTPDALADEVQYIDQVTAESYTWEFELREEHPENYSFVVVFVSGTDASVQKIAIPLVAYSESGTVTFENGTDFTGSAPTFTAEGGADGWKDQLVGTVEDAEGTAVEATFDFTAGTITMEAPFEKTTYTATIINSAEGGFDPNFSATKTFTLISEEGAAAAEAIEELNALPASLDVTVETGDDAYTITIPADTENITYTVTVDGEAVADRPVVVDRADEGGEPKAVVVTAAANGTDSTKTRTINVPAKGVVGPQIAEDDVEIITAKSGAAVYSSFLEGDNVIVTIAVGTIDPASQSVKVNGTDFYYVEKCGYFVGIVPRAEKAEIIAAVEIGDGASDVVVYGRDPSRLDKPIGNADFIAVKKIALEKVTNPSHKELLSADVGNGKMDGAIGNPDFIAVKRVALEKDDDFAINK